MAILIILALLVGATAACQNTPKTTPTTATVSTPTPVVQIDPFMKFDPPIEVSVIKTADTFFGYSEDQTPSNNDIYKLWEDVVGIKFVNKIETASAAYEQKVRLAISSNDLPDLIATSAADFAEMIRNDMISDIKPLMDSYMSPKTKNSLGAFEGKLYGPISSNGGIFGLPASSNVEGALRTCWIRKDWLDAVGKPIPTTMEEILDLAMDFTTKDPDKNGKDDTFGLPLDKDINTSLINTLEIVANAYDLYPSRVVKNASGEVVLGTTDPGMKAVMQKFQDMYKAGAIDPEFASKDFMQVDADVGAGKYGLWMGVFWKPVDPGFASTYKDGVEWIAAPISKSTTVATYHPYVAFPVSAYYGMSKKFAHPEALLVMANHFMSDDLQNKDGWAYNWGVTGNKHVGIPTNNWSPVQWQDPLYFSSSPLVKALADKNFDRTNPAYPVHGQAYDILSGFAKADAVTVKQFDDIFIDSIGIHEKYITNNFVFEAYFGAPTETQKKQGSILDKMETEAFVQIISGSKPVEYYDTFVAEYLKQGGTAVLTEIKAELAK
jgi:putative aldouronate transport system substrate-binding protein